MLTKALKIATIAHEGQVDKGGNPYILHPIAVSSMLESEDERIVAFLHDVVEDTPFTLGQLEKYGFSDSVIDAVNAITRRKGEEDKDYIKRIKENRIACKVKMADLKHNMDLGRIAEPCEEDYARVEQYKNTLEQLSICLVGM